MLEEEMGRMPVEQSPVVNELVMAAVEREEEEE